VLVEPSFKKAVEALKNSRKLLVLTGAGISRESGLDTFRNQGDDGLWGRYNPMELATPEAFSRDPQLVWNWYAFRRETASKAEPNPGHHTLAEWERVFPEFLLVTQNVDGLHQRAGSRKILCLHGNLFEVRCMHSSQVFKKSGPLAECPLKCRCGAMFRPHIVWFGENLFPGVMENAMQAASESDLLLAVGTSLVVYPAAGLVPLALEQGTPVIEINPEPSDFSNKTLHLQGKSGEILPRLQEALGVNA